jgi:hypothetical protein
MSAMQLRYCGDLTIGLHYCGRTADNRATYLGYVRLPDGREWKFADLQTGVGEDGTRATDYDEMARSAVGFAAYWTSHNRAEVPDWAPPADIADSFEDAASVGEEDYIIDRTPPPRT